MDNNTDPDFQSTVAGEPALIRAKASLRSEMRRIRDDLDAVYRWRQAEAIATLDLSLILSFDAGLALDAGAVALYWSMGSEFDTSLLEIRLRSSGRAIALPVMQGRHAPLLFRSYETEDQLEERVWGIREPAASAALVEPAIVVVPLLAFDAAGYRLGYGGGFYDRTLSELRAARPVLSVGLAYDEQRVDAVPHAAYDQRLDYVLTPSGLLPTSSV